MVVKAVDDRRVALDAGIQRAPAGNPQHFLRLGQIGFHGEGQLQNRIPRRVALAAEKLVAVGLFQVRPPDDLLRHSQVLPAPLVQVVAEGGRQVRRFVSLEKVLQVSLLEQQRQQLVRADSVVVRHGSLTSLL